MDSSTTIYIGNLRQNARITELKTSLQKLMCKVLNVPNLTANDISIVNGPKRYAIVDVHHRQNVEYVLENLSNHSSRKKLKFNFDTLVEEGFSLHADTLKSQDNKQTQDDFENGKNLPRPFRRPHRHVRKRPDYGVPVLVKSSTSQSWAARNYSKSELDHVTPVNDEDTSQQNHDFKETHEPQISHRSQSEVCTSTDLDVTLDSYPTHDRDKSLTSNDEIGEALNRAINMRPVDVSTLKVNIIAIHISLYKFPAFGFLCPWIK